MSCIDFRNSFSDYLDGLLAPEQAAELANHLAACKECERAFSELTLTVSHLRGLQQVEPPDWMTRKIMARIEQEAPKKWYEKLLRPLPVKIPLQAAATVLVVVAAVYLFKMSETEITKKAPVRERDREEQVIPSQKQKEQREQSPAATKESESRKAVKGGTQRSAQPATGPEPVLKGETSERPLMEAPPGAPDQDRRHFYKTDAVSPAAPQDLPPQAAPPAPARLYEQKAGGASGTMVAPKKEEHGGESLKRSAPSMELRQDNAAVPGSEKAKRAGADARSEHPFTLYLKTREREKAVEQISKYLAQAGAAGVKKSTFADKTVITFGLETSKIDALSEHLRKYGDVMQALPVPTTAGKVMVLSIEIREISP